MKYLYASAANLLALSLLPLLLWQGKRTRHITPRLPEAAGKRSGQVVGTGLTQRSLRLLAIGESPVAGVGVEQQQQAITSRLAHHVAQQQQCAVTWQALGKNGATLADAIAQLLPQVPALKQDIVLLAFGVNDTSSFRSVARYQRELQHVTQHLLAQCQPRLLLIAGVPPLGHFPALPQPLRYVLGLKARSLHHASLALVRQFQKRGQCNIVYVPVGFDLQDASLLASDGYHPSSAGSDAWARALAHELQQQMQQMP